MTAIRKRTAERLAHARQTAAHLTTRNEIEKAIADFAKGAQVKKLVPDELTGSTIPSRKPKRNSASAWRVSRSIPT